MVQYGLADSVVTTAPAPATDDDENADDGDISEEEIAEIVQDSIRRQLDAVRRQVS